MRGSETSMLARTLHIGLKHPQCLGCDCKVKENQHDILLGVLKLSLLHSFCRSGIALLELR